MYKFLFTTFTFFILTKIVSAQCSSQVNASENVSICFGESVQLSASDAITYSWKASSSLSNLNISNPIAKPPTSTTYRLTGTDQDGCQSFDSVRVTVLSRPVLSVANREVFGCNNSTVKLEATGSGQFSWLPALGLSSSTVSNPVLTLSQSRYYVVKLTGANGCTSKDSIYAGIRSIAAVKAGSDANACQSNSYTEVPLDFQFASCDSIACKTNGYGTFNIFNNRVTYIISPNDERRSLTVVAKGYSKADGCWATDSLYLLLASPPMVSAGPDLFVNEEGKVPLSGSVANADGGVWSGGMGSFTNGNRQLNTTYQASDNEIQSGQIVLWLTSTGNRGCEAASDNVRVKIQKDTLQSICADRQRNFDIGPANVTVCFNLPQQLKVNKFYRTVRWEAPVAIADGSTNVQITTSGQYKVTVQDTLGCIAKDSVQVVYDYRLQDFNLKDTIWICFNNPESINVTGAIIQRITWLAPSPIVIPDGSVNYKPTTQGVYKVNVSASTCHASDSVVVLYRDSSHIASDCQIRTPYKFNEIPGTIEAENFDKGAEKITYHDLDEQNFGGVYRVSGVDVYSKDNNHYIGYIWSEEWLEYTINVAQEGLYDIAFRVSTQVEGGSFHLSINGKHPEAAGSGTNNRVAASNIVVPNTGKGVWTLVSKKVNLDQGTNVLRIVIDGGGFLLDHFETKYIGTVTAAVDENAEKTSRLIISPIAGTKSYELINCPTTATSISIRDVTGKLVQLIDSSFRPVTFGQSLPCGLYFISVVDNESVHTQKVFIGN